MSDPILSSLCTICHVNPHKYRCPRCSILTCSLSCIKRHKQWAQCNGIRDPTVYIKRADLATPKGIDHDYNYLTSIEREIDHAERDAASRGVILEEVVRGRKDQVKGVIQLKAAVERCGVIVAKAPKGMTRSKQNETFCSKKNKNIIWTVEWVHPDGHRDLGKCPETQSISEAYAAFLKHLENNRPSKRRKMHTGRQGHPSTAKVASTSGPPGSPLRHNCSTKIPKTEPSISATTVKQELENPAWSKRKELDMLRQKVQESRTSAAKLNHDGQVREAAERTDGTQPQTVKPDIFSPTHVNAAEPSVDHAGPIAREAQQIPEKVISLNEPNSSEEAEQEALSKNDQGERGERESIEEKVVLDQAQTSASTAAPPNPSPIVAHPEPTESLAFYLHHPSLPSRNPVLIPFSPDANLATSLSSRLVLEFPTIFALHLQPDGKLPDGFISEDDFFAKTKKGLIEEVAEGDLIGESIGSVGVVGEGLEDGEVDEGRLLEVLGKDLKGIAGSL